MASLSPEIIYFVYNTENFIVVLVVKGEVERKFICFLMLQTEETISSLRKEKKKTH
jgi:hypothetical protein